MAKAVGYYMREGWRGPIMFYQFKCPKHGLVVDYPHGHAQRLECPVCGVEELKSATPKIPHA